MGFKLCQASWNKYIQKLEIRFHILKVCSKANRKLTILCRILKVLTFKKRSVVIKAYFESQFKYFPLVRMFHGRQVNDKPFA